MEHLGVASRSAQHVVNSRKDSTCGSLSRLSIVSDAADTAISPLSLLGSADPSTKRSATSITGQLAGHLDMTSLQPQQQDPVASSLQPDQPRCCVTDKNKKRLFYLFLFLSVSGPYFLLAKN